MDLLQSGVGGEVFAPWQIETVTQLFRYGESEKVTWQASRLKMVCLDDGDRPSFVTESDY